VILILLILITAADDDDGKNAVQYMDKWNPLQFPNTKLCTILSFDDATWNKLTSRSDDESLRHPCGLIQQCLYDAIGFTLQSKLDSGSNTASPSTSLSTTIYSQTYTKREHDSSTTSSSGRRRRSRSMLQAHDDGESYDALLDGVIAFKNIAKSLLPATKQLNYTLGILFNDMDIYDEFESILASASTNHYHRLLHNVLHQCLHLTLNVESVQLHLLSRSEGVFRDESKNKAPRAHNHTNANHTDFDIDVDGTNHTAYNESDLEGYKVMITLNATCLRLQHKLDETDAIIDEIAAFYGKCLRFKDGNMDKYKTYKVSAVDMVYFFKIKDNDKSCLIDIDMEYLETKCVDIIEYEPIYELDLVSASNLPPAPMQHIECAALSVAEWNLDFFDAAPEDHVYSALDTHHVDRGVDIYVLDTGILSSHEIFEHNNNQNLVYIHQLRVAGGSAAATASPFTPSHYHGTYVAGIAGGDHYGISRNLTIYDYEVCVGSACTYSKVLDGIEAAKVNMIATGRRGVINLSFGGPIAAANNPAREKWDFIMKGIIDAGGIPVCSAGNTQLNGCNYVPGQSPYCISVGAFDQYGELYARTNYGECVTIFAPGVAIKSAGTTSPSQYITRSGTSAAAPHITGLISNLLWIEPSLSYEHIVYILQHNQHFLPSCPSNYTEHTQCPYVSLPCHEFQAAIHDALLNVISSDTTSPAPTPPPTSSPITLSPTSADSDGDIGNVLYSSPTTNPTAEPTPTPSDSPSRAPTWKPTESPTMRPTRARKLTASPTEAPTFVPTKAPTNPPTSEPTELPTVDPTVFPTMVPTMNPTDIPSEDQNDLDLEGFNNGFHVDIDADDVGNLTFLHPANSTNHNAHQHNDVRRLYMLCISCNGYDFFVFLCFSLYVMLCHI